MISLGELAKRAGIPDSTVSYYVKHFPEFLVQHRIEGRRNPMYKEQAVEIVKIISQMTKERTPRHEIKSTLSESYDPIIDAEQAKPTTQEQIINDIKPTIYQQQLATSHLVAIQGTIRATLRILEDQDKVIERQEQEIKDLKQEIKELTATNKRLKTQDPTQQNQPPSWNPFRRRHR